MNTVHTMQVYKGVLNEVHEVAVKVFQGYVAQAEQDLLLKGRQLGLCQVMLCKIKS